MIARCSLLAARRPVALPGLAAINGPTTAWAGPWAARAPLAGATTALSGASGIAGFSTKSGGKKKLTFKLAKKLLRVRNDAVPFKNRQKRAMLMNYAHYTVNNPYESHWANFMQQRLSAASGSLDSVFRERFGVEDAAATTEEAEDEAATLELPSGNELADAYHTAQGDPDALLKLLQAGHEKAAGA
jgi:hypothetical protein